MPAQRSQKLPELSIPAADGGALPRIIARWISELQTRVTKSGISPDDAGFSAALNREVLEALREIEFLVGGFDFARVVTAY